MASQPTYPQGLPFSRRKVGLRSIHFRPPQRANQYLDTSPRIHHGSCHCLLLLPFECQLQHVDQGRHLHSGSFLLCGMQMPGLFDHLAHDEQHITPNIA